MPTAAKFSILILVIAAFALLGWWIFRNYFDTYHLATVKSGILYRDGVRTMPQFQLALQKTHAKTIVCLVDDREIRQSPFAEEMKYCTQNEINVIRIPITLGGWPDGPQIQQFISVTQDPAQQPVLVHCAQGVRRTGMLVAAYQLSVMNYDKPKAEAEIQTFGHSDRTVNDVKRFIETYDPEKQEMKTQLAPSQE